jgi:branched-subunit amino acid permease
VGELRFAQIRAKRKTRRKEMAPTFSTIEEIFRDLLVFVAVMTALLIVLIVVVSKLPNENPLKRILTALSYRIGATAAAGAVAVPVEPIPGLDALYDIGVPVLLIWYWFTFFRDAYRAMSNKPPSAPAGPGQIGSDRRV